MADLYDTPLLLQRLERQLMRCLRAGSLVIGLLLICSGCASNETSPATAAPSNPPPAPVVSFAEIPGQYPAPATLTGSH